MGMLMMLHHAIHKRAVDKTHCNDVQSWYCFKRVDDGQDVPNVRVDHIGFVPACVSHKQRECAFVCGV
jgi:hypothetical protein